MSPSMANPSRPRPESGACWALGNLSAMGFLLRNRLRAPPQSEESRNKDIESPAHGRAKDCPLLESLLP